MRKFVIRRFATAAVIAACAASVNAASILPPDDDEELVPTGKGWGHRAYPETPGHNNGKGGPPSGANGISYHGGPVMLPFPAVAFEETIHDMFRMRILIVSRGQGGDPRSATFGGPRTSAEREGRGGSHEKFPACAMRRALTNA